MFNYKFAFKKLLRLFGDLSVYNIEELYTLLKALEEYAKFVKEEIKK